MKSTRDSMDVAAGAPTGAQQHGARRKRSRSSKGKTADSAAPQEHESAEAGPSTGRATPSKRPRTTSKAPKRTKAAKRTQSSSSAGGADDASVLAEISASLVDPLPMSSAMRSSRSKIVAEMGDAHRAYMRPEGGSSDDVPVDTDDLAVRRILNPPRPNFPQRPRAPLKIVPDGAPSDAEHEHLARAGAPRKASAADSADVSAAAQLKAYQQERLVQDLRKREEALEAQVASLQANSKQQQAVISAMNSTLESVSNACQCHICLDAIWRPFALVPCGHVFCLSCLVSWFEKPDPHDPPIPAHYTETMRSEEECWRRLNRKKVCPECRATLTQRPIELWSTKLVLDGLDSGASAVRALKSDARPAIERAGADAAPTEAVPSAEDPTYGYEPEESGEQRDAKLGLTKRLQDAQTMLLGKQRGVWDGIFPAYDALNALRPRFAEPRFDEADRVYRCPDCGCELLDGECEDCGFMWDDFEDEHDDGGTNLFYMGGALGPMYDSDMTDSEWDEEWDEWDGAGLQPLPALLTANVAAHSEAAASATVPAALPLPTVHFEGSDGDGDARMLEVWAHESEEDENGNLAGLIDDDDAGSLLSDSSTDADSALSGPARRRIIIIDDDDDDDDDADRSDDSVHNVGPPADSEDESDLGPAVHVRRNVYLEESEDDDFDDEDM